MVYLEEPFELIVLPADGPFFLPFHLLDCYLIEVIFHSNIVILFLLLEAQLELGLAGLPVELVDLCGGEGDPGAAGALEGVDLFAIELVFWLSHL